MMKWYFPALILLLQSCKVCKVKMGYASMAVDRSELLCKCSQLKENDIFTAALRRTGLTDAIYAAAPVIVKNRKGIYQYVSSGQQVYKNRFAWYNGKNVYPIQFETLEQYIDSLSALDVSRREMEEQLWEIRKKIQPAEKLESF